MSEKQESDKTAINKESKKEKYIPPKIVTYTTEEILEQFGPALACSPSPCPTESPSSRRRKPPR